MKKKIPFARLKVAQIYHSDLDPDIWDYCKSKSEFKHQEPDCEPELIVYSDVFRQMIQEEKDLPANLTPQLIELIKQFIAFDYIMILPTHPDNL